MKLKSKKIVSALATYEVKGTLGEGGAGIVYLATRDDGVDVAIKVLKPLPDLREKLKRFRNELHFSVHTRDPHIVPVSDFGQVETDGGTATYYVMPRFAETLRMRMKSGLAPAAASEMVIALFDAVEAVHRRHVWHRDLKPENFLLAAGSAVLVVSDFGAAHFHSDYLITAVETTPNDRLANFEYAAPEQRRKGGTVNHLGDLYAVGLIIHELFTGEVPHGKGHRLIADVDANLGYLDDIVTWLTQHDSAKRPASIEDVRIRLIGMKKEAGSRLRMSQIEDTVRSVTESDDPLIADPPRLVGVDVQDRTVHLKLSRPVNAAWIQAFQHTNYGTAMMGGSPSDFSFSGDDISLALRYNAPSPSIVQQVIDDFKRFLGLGAVHYKDLEAARLRREEEEFRTRKQAQFDAERKRLELLSNIKI